MEEVTQAHFGSKETSGQISNSIDSMYELSI